MSRPPHAGAMSATTMGKQLFTQAVWSACCSRASSRSLILVFMVAPAIACTAPPAREIDDALVLADTGTADYGLLPCSYDGALPVAIDGGGCSAETAPCSDLTQEALRASAACGAMSCLFCAAFEVELDGAGCARRITATGPDSIKPTADSMLCIARRLTPGRWSCDAAKPIRVRGWCD